MQERELAVGDTLVIAGVGRLTVKDVEGGAALLGLELLDEAEEARLRGQEDADRVLG